MATRAQAIPQTSRRLATIYRVFLSSTSRDLAEYREGVHRAIDGLPGFELVKMEDFGARDMNAKDLCARLVRECDLFVGLMGHYYGSCPPGESVSFTELEYRTATTANLPRLMFVAPDDFPIPASLRESDASFEHQQAFRREVMADRVVAAFDTPEKLASAVTRALFVWDKERQQAAQTGPAGGSEGTEPAAPESEAAKPLGLNPYRGLEAFRKEDANRFFGREALVDQLWNEFLELHATRPASEPLTRLMAIVGSSGSGKSSIAQAGLLAELERRPLPGRPVPLEVVFTPKARPLESLAVVLASEMTKEPSPARKAIEFEEVLRTRESHDGLRYLAERMLDVGGAGVILLVDQFEELYSLCDVEQERAAFIGNLINAAREPQGRVSVLLILRSDFLGAVNQHPELSRLIARQNVVLPVMSDEELRRAIEEPAKRAGREIEPATVDLLLEQSRGREGALPLLEFVLTSIWEGFARGVSAAETVSALGGVGGALATRAQAVYESLGPEEQEIARRAFLAMVRLGQRTQDMRRPARVSEMLARGQSVDQVLRVLRRFADPGCRLITLTGADGTTIAEVAHEALFDHWQLLRDWLNASRQDLWSRLRLTRVLKTASFRLALIYLASFGISALALIGSLYYATAGFMERQTEETIQAEIVGLVEQYHTEGLARLRDVIALRSAAQPHRSSIYLLVDARSQRVAGNLDRWPDVVPGPDGWLTFTIEVTPDGATVQQRRARAASFLVNDGYRLLVGREVEGRLQIEAQIRRTLGWGLALTLLLGLAGTLLISRGMLGRVDAIHRTARRIMTGDLSQRIALTGSRDEFDQVAANLNEMLDEIERLRIRAGETKQAGQK